MVEHVCDGLCHVLHQREFDEDINGGVLLSRSGFVQFQCCLNGGSGGEYYLIQQHIARVDQLFVFVTHYETDRVHQQPCVESGFSL